MIICEICNKSMKRIGSHIVKIHGLSLQEYYDKYLLVVGEDICKCGKKKKFGRDLKEGYPEHCSRSCSTKSKEVQNKMRKTCKERHGFECFFEQQELKEKAMMKKYGVINALQSKEIYEKMKKTVQDRYGVDHISQCPEIHRKKERTQFLNFGTLYCKTDEARHNYRENFIKRIENIKGPYKVMLGKNETKILDSLENNIDYTIERTWKICGYFLDGYIPELNIAIEIDEKYHNETWIKGHDQTRERVISESLNCLFFRVLEQDWFNDSNKIILDFKSFIEVSI